jgi:multisubunit Na+/H+ antiporter MnhB subunit
MFNQIDLKYDGPASDPNASRFIVACSVLGFLIVMILVLFNHDAHNGGLRPYIEESISSSGVTNPVTAVLLNFRAYDTLLEIAVLLIVVIAVLPIRDHKAPLVQSIERTNHDLVLTSLQRWLAPTVLMFAGYLLWAGATQPGGAFQAGALLAGACVLMFQTGTYRINYTSIMARSLMACGLVMFIAVGIALVWFEGSLLSYPQDYAGVLILLIESCATLSIAICLASLYSNLIDIPGASPVVASESDS